jgi:hypothetical protein
MAENKSNTQYFERALSKSLTKFGHTMLKEQQIKSHVFESLLLTAKAQDVFAALPTGFGESRLIYQVLQALFSELYRLRHGTIKNLVIALLSR